MFFKLHNVWGGAFSLPFQCLKIVRPHSRRVASGGKLGRPWSLCTLQLGVGAGSQIYDRMEKQENQHEQEKSLHAHRFKAWSTEN